MRRRDTGCAVCRRRVLDRQPIGVSFFDFLVMLRRRTAVTERCPLCGSCSSAVPQIDRAAEEAAGRGYGQFERAVRLGLFDRGIRTVSFVAGMVGNNKVWVVSAEDRKGILRRIVAPRNLSDKAGDVAALLEDAVERASLGGYSSWHV